MSDANLFFGDDDDRFDVDSGIASAVFLVNNCLITDVRLLLAFALSPLPFGLPLSLDGEGVFVRLVCFAVVSVVGLDFLLSVVGSLLFGESFLRLREPNCNDPNELQCKSSRETSSP